jgi:hypothetical protein
MSWRTWLGDNRTGMDYNLCDYNSMGELCAAASWHLPAKVFSPTRQLMDEFLKVMAEEHCMTWDDFWFLKIGDGTNNLVSDWRDYASTPTKASIEVMEMFGKFIEKARL